jgi:hypothetical protein
LAYVLLNYFYSVETVHLEARIVHRRGVLPDRGKRLLEEVKDPKSGDVIVKSGRKKSTSSLSEGGRCGIRERPLRRDMMGRICLES